MVCGEAITLQNIDQREVQRTSGADFGTSELIRHLGIINGFPFPLPLSTLNQQEDFDDDR